MEKTQSFSANRRVFVAAKPMLYLFLEGRKLLVRRKTHSTSFLGSEQGDQIRL
jgi:hypothetical protein